MKTKIIPFDLEMAKKIQAGEIKGRIINSIGTLVEIISFNVANTPTSIVGIVHYPQTDSVIYIRKNGTCFNSIHDLIIELPEETQKTQADLCEEAWLEEQKHKPYIKQLLKLKDYTGQLMEVNQGAIDNLDNLVQDLKRICEPPKQKHEFKPFDKVLVRESDESLWRAGFYSHKLEDGRHYVSGLYYRQCIPYEGNEHLVGTTDKPKELC